jgi:hypothetical protein
MDHPPLINKDESFKDPDPLFINTPEWIFSEDHCQSIITVFHDQD